MALNPKSPPYWDIFDDFGYNYETELFDSVSSEFNDISGFPIDYYIKLNTENADYLYGEDPNGEFSSPHRTKLIYEPTEEPQTLNVFGISSDDTLTYTQMTKTIFKRDVTDEVPKVGDVIKTLWNNKLYEIVEVGSEQKIFQGMKLIWEFILRPYRHSEDSDSADEMLFVEPEEDEFPDINITTETRELSAYGNNKDIGKESKDNYDYQGINTKTTYGYDTLDD